VAAEEKREQAGSQGYQDDHFGKILKEGFSFSGFERDHLWWNDGGGRFVDLAGLSGLDSPTDGRGALYADLDDDGDLDIFRTSFQGRSHLLYRNNVGAENAFLRISLVGTASGRDAFGATVRAATSRGTQTAIKSGGVGYVSGGDPRLLLGLGSDRAVARLEVTWPSGTVQTFDDVAAGSIRITEDVAEPERLEEIPFSLPDPPSAEVAMLAKLRIRPGDLFPDLALIDTDGVATSFAATRTAGRPTLVNLWATWCVPCRREMPELAALAERAPDRLDVVGISLDTGAARGQVPRVAAKLGVGYPVFTTEEPAWPEIFAGEEVFIPLTYLVGADGRVLEVFAGWSEEMTERVLAVR
jgi:thiol-disulfide isomerase/thioredoxin